MTPTEARAYNLACRDIIDHIEHEYGDTEDPLVKRICAEIYTMQLKTAYKVTEISPYHSKQEAVAID